MPKGFQPGNKEAKKKGKHKKTLEMEAALKLYQERIYEELKDFIQSQFIMAKGISVMFRRKKIKVGKEWKRAGEFQRVRDEYEIERLLNSNCEGEDWYFITTKDPNIKALEDIFNRVFGKPKESMDLTTGGKPIPIPSDLRAIIKKTYGGKTDTQN